MEINGGEEWSSIISYSHLDVSNFYFIMAAFFCAIAFAFLLYGKLIRKTPERPLFRSKSTSKSFPG